ncbi:MAG: hypothetical protein IJG38_00055 [Thermoguttaceae bacterium]|nr:hypothetical protein [Thermoguttaceae bacterium]
MVKISSAAEDCRDPDSTEVISEAGKGARDRRHPREVFGCVVWVCTFRCVLFACRRMRNSVRFAHSITAFHLKIRVYPSNPLNP